MCRLQRRVQENFNVKKLSVSGADILVLVTSRGILFVILSHTSIRTIFSIKVTFLEKGSYAIKLKKRNVCVKEWSSKCIYNIK